MSDTKRTLTITPSLAHLAEELRLLGLSFNDFLRLALPHYAFLTTLATWGLWLILPLGYLSLLAQGVTGPSAGGRQTGGDDCAGEDTGAVVLYNDVIQRSHPRGMLQHLFF
ncbi:hypothetical protein GC175_30335 [bacterium]|nr:hypothetical protein [bacterium]